MENFPLSASKSKKSDLFGNDINCPRKFSQRNGKLFHLLKTTRDLSVGVKENEMSLVGDYFQSFVFSALVDEKSQTYLDLQRKRCFLNSAIHTRNIQDSSGLEIEVNGGF